MTRTPGEIAAAVAAAESIPYGPARSSVLERIVAECDALGDEELGTRARLNLITAYCYGGEPLKRFTPFAWVLARFDENPPWFDASMRHALLWYFKWVTVGMLSHPAVPLAQIEAGLADMAQRYAAAGEGDAPYLGCRFVITQHVHGPHAARDDYRAWTRAPRTDLSDCVACEPTIRAAHLQRLGRFEDVVREAAPVLARGTCQEQPQFMISVALEALLQTGRHAQAAREHLRGVRLFRNDPSATEMCARHVHVCARSGRLLRGLDLLEERLHEIEQPPSPGDGMWLAAAGARLLHALDEAGHGDLVIAPRVPGNAVPYTVSALATRLTAKARGTAREFDARNGTTAVTEHVDSWLDAGDLPDLPIDAARVRPRGIGGATPRRPRGTGPARLHTPPVPRNEPGARAPALRTLVEDLAASSTSGVPAARAAVLATWRRIRTRHTGLPPEHPDAAGVARLEAALALETLRETLEGTAGQIPTPQGETRTELAVRTARAPAARLRATGQAGAAALHEQLCLAEQTRASRRIGSPLDLIAMTRIVREAGSLAQEVERSGPRADAGCAHLRHYGLLRWLAERAQEHQSAPSIMAVTPDSGPVAVVPSPAPAGEVDAGLAAEAAMALEQGLAAFSGLSPDTLTGYQRACWAMLHLARSEGRDGRDRIDSLRAALALVPEGVRRGERAVVGKELGGALALGGDLVEAAEILAQASEDAQAAEDLPLHASSLSQLGVLYRHLGLHSAAVDALSRVIPMWEQLAEDLPADRARFDLAWALVDDHRPVEAAEVAESTLTAAEAAIDQEETPGRCVFAGMLAYCAATAARELGQDAHATGLAERSAAWHARADNVVAQAESLQLAAECHTERTRAATRFAEAAALYQEGGEVLRAVACLRARTMAVVHADGLDAARIALADAARALERACEAEADLDERQLVALEWQRIALADQAVRVLATGGAKTEALEAVQGLEERYRDIGDVWSARDVVGLRALLLDDLGRGLEALEDLQAAAQDATDGGELSQARTLGSQLAAILEALGCPAEADAAWERFRGN